MNYLRVWKELDIDEIKEHIIMVDDVTGHCPNCKKIGINLKDLDRCPQCEREFKYVTSSESKGNKVDIVHRIKRKLPDLVFVDYNDFQRLTAQNEADNLFKI